MVFETWCCIQIQNLFEQASSDVSEKQYGKCFLFPFKKILSPFILVAVLCMIIWLVFFFFFIFIIVVINRTDLFELRTAGVWLLKFQSCKNTNLQTHSHGVKLLTVRFSVWWVIQDFPTISNFKRTRITWESRRDVVVCLVAWLMQTQFFSTVSSVTSGATLSELSVWTSGFSENASSQMCVCLLQHANEDVERMLLGNKCDMEDKRVVPKAKGEQVRDCGWIMD